MCSSDLLNLWNPQMVWKLMHATGVVLVNMTVVCCHLGRVELSNFLNGMIGVVQFEKERPSSSAGVPLRLKILGLRMSFDRFLAWFVYQFLTLGSLIGATLYLGDCNHHFLDQVLPGQICAIRTKNEYSGRGRVHIRRARLFISDPNVRRVQHVWRRRTYV